MVDSALHESVSLEPIASGQAAYRMQRAAATLVETRR
jgi:hypothetical protein